MTEANRMAGACRAQVRGIIDQCLQGAWLALDGLVAVNDPALVLDVAMVEFQAKGRDERLVIAAEVIAQSGAAGLRAVAPLIRSMSPDVEYFVAAVVHSEAEDRALWRELVEELAANPDENAQDRLGASRALLRVVTQRE